MSHETEEAGGAITEAEAPLYERMPNEAALHFEWFHTYLLMGPSRSLRGAYASFHQKSPKVAKNPQISPGWKEAARRWRWQERAAVWDAEQRRKREEEVDAQKREIYGALLEKGRKLLKVSNQMNDFPLVETESTTVDAKGHKTVVLKPTRWSMDTAARIANVAATLFKTAFELEDNRAGAEVDAESTEDAIEGAIETLKTLGYIVVAPGQEIPGADEDDED
jgi:hypothetical protein